MPIRRLTRSARPAVIALAALVVASIAHAQSPSPYRLLDVLVFGAFLQVDASAYSPEVRNQLQQHLKRSESYRPRPRPAKQEPWVMEMVHTAREGYERRLVAAASRSGVEALAQRYVDDLKPCYEWEGFHDCPEREARFAEQYLAANPTSPFREFLQLLDAHRWICTAEGYEREEMPQEAARARRAAEPSLATALQSRPLLIRTAAQELKELGRCHPGV